MNSIFFEFYHYFLFLNKTLLHIFNKEIEKEGRKHVYIGLAYFKTFGFSDGTLLKIIGGPGSNYEVHFFGCCFIG